MKQYINYPSSDSISEISRNYRIYFGSFSDFF